ncbi:MAG: DUF2283 domain-containing protein [Verrucomicrobiota bacterium]|jgi:uncharacterized protein YuzE|nr:DUF2283 domain-containing protein [Verrucomicrobiota bacterium]
MKIKFDQDSDSFYVRLDEERIVESEEIEPGVILDYDDKGVVVGVEFLHAAERTKGKALPKFEYQTA